MTRATPKHIEAAARALAKHQGIDPDALWCDGAGGPLSSDDQMAVPYWTLLRKQAIPIVEAVLGVQGALIDMNADECAMEKTQYALTENAKH